MSLASAVTAMALLLASPAGAWPATPPVMVRHAMRLPDSLALVDQNGRTVSAADLKGRPTLVYFGYRLCAEACPVTLASMTRWIRRLGPAASGINFLFVSIDPERDRPAALKDYLTDFDPHIRALTGTVAGVGDLTRAFGVYVQKVPSSEGDYTMDHSTSAFLLDKQGLYVEEFKYDVPEAEALGRIRYILDVYR